MIHKQNQFNDSPDEGFEYILAKVRFDYLDGSADKQFHLNTGVDFTAVSSEGKDYKLQLVVEPEPRLNADLYPGASHEGWVAFQVTKDDTNPLMTFGRDYRGSGGVWWKLFTGTTPAMVLPKTIIAPAIQPPATETTLVTATVTPTRPAPTPTSTPVPTSTNTPEPEPTPTPSLVPTPTPEPASTGEAFTVAAWVKFRSLTPAVPNDPLSPNGDMSIMDKMLDDGYNLDGWRLMKQDDNRFWLCFGDNPINGCQSGKDTTVTSTTVATVDQWYHVLGVRSSDRISIYINGALESSKPLPQYTDTGTAPLLIGKNALEGACLNGWMESMFVKERVMGDAEIRAISGLQPGTSREIKCP